MARWNCRQIYLIATLTTLAQAISIGAQSPAKKTPAGQKSSGVATTNSIASSPPPKGNTNLPQQQTAQGGSGTTLQQKEANTMAAVMAVFAQVVQAVVQQIEAGGGSVTAADQQSLLQAAADAAIIQANTATVEALPTLDGSPIVIVVEVIGGFSAQNTAAGYPQPNQLTRAQIDQVMSSIPAGNTSNARLVNDLKKLLGTMKPRR